MLGMTRVDVIRRSLIRDMEYVVCEELERTPHQNEKQEKRYREWAVLKAKVALLERYVNAYTVGCEHAAILVDPVHLPTF